MKNLKTDVLVLGAGIAGLEAACAARTAGAEVLLLSKGESASPWVLGFNAPVGREDSVACFTEDTLRGGWQIGDPILARTLAQGALETVTQMESLGLSFDRKADAPREYHLLKPLGCSHPRLVHHENATGRESLRVLRSAALKSGVSIRERWMALSLLKKDIAIQGVLALDLETMEPALILCGAVCLCTGGAHLMEKSTYPLCQTADGYQLAYQAGAALIDMEFIQHEPCRAVWPRPLGLSTTLLSKGGILKNALGERFVLREYENEGAAPKDQLARLIAQEILSGRGSPHGGVYLDLTGLPPEEIRENHSMYYQRFLGAGIDLTRNIVEVGPAAHSIMGGVRIRPDASTDVSGLFAAGEVAGGIHGANRLGGNAGSEIYVFGRIAGKSAAAWCASHPATGAASPWAEEVSAFLPVAGGRQAAYFEAAIPSIRRVLSRALGPVRCGEELKKALEDLEGAEKQLLSPGCDWAAQKARQEALNLARTGMIACRAALNREESRGVHFRSDFPRRDDARFGRSFPIVQQGEQA